MRSPHVSAHLDCSTQIECNTMVASGLSGSDVCLKLYPKDDRYNGLDVFMSWDRLRRLHAVIGASLAAHGRLHEDPDGLADRVDIMAAEAVVDASPILGLVLIDQEVS